MKPDPGLPRGEADRSRKVTVNAAKLVLELYEADAGNCFDDPAMGRLFDPPTVAIASADDAWFTRFKEIIGEFHWTPREALALADARARARSVICWCLPVGRAAREANRREDRTPARPWAYVRTFGEQFNNRLRHGLEARLRELGHAAMAPQESPLQKARERPEIGWSSCWSERHVAFVAGLGTFGISGGLITARGVAHRLGSVVTDLELAATPRPYGDEPFAWCLRCAQGTCGECIKRCPASAIGQSVEQRDKKACFQWTYDSVRGDRGESIFGWKGAYGCGLCQTAVPCEECNPVAQ